MIQISFRWRSWPLWALTSLLSRERSRCRPDRGRPRPPKAHGLSPAFARNQSPPRRTQRGGSDRPCRSRRWPAAALATVAVGHWRTLPDDDIRILESDPRSARSTVELVRSPYRPQHRLPERRAAQSRRGSRPDSARKPDTAGTTVEPHAAGHSPARSTRAWPRPLTGRSKSLRSISPWRRSARRSSRWPPERPSSAASRHEARTVPGMDAKPSVPCSPRPSKLREIAILSEVLKPPLAFAARRRFPLSTPVRPVLPALASGSDRHSGSSDWSPRADVTVQKKPASVRLPMVWPAR